jgi:hypothetical protein
VYLRFVCSLLCAAAAVGVVQAAPLDSTWISYYNGADGWFSFQGPQRAMKLNPADFGVEHPFQVESLKTWWYWGMGSREDTVYTFRIYGGDGATVLWESESMVAPASNWTYYGLSTPVTIDTGSFYIATTHRLANPWAHPYVNVDTGPTNHSYYGTPGGWTLDNVGEFCFFAFVRELQVGVGEGKWVGTSGRFAAPTLVRGTLRLPEGERAMLLNAAGRRLMGLKPGANDVHLLPPGVYLLRPESGRATSKVVVR